MLRFVHLTDTHIGPTPHFSLYGRQTLPLLQRAVSVINDLPFHVDFVLHTGDVVDDRSSAAYELAKEAMAKLRVPAHYVAGNHDDAETLQRIVLGRDRPTPRLDYAFDCQGVRVVVLDSRGPDDPGGHLPPAALDLLRRECTESGPPLVIAMHHCPLPLDTPWLDAPPPRWGGRFMFIDNAADVLAAIRPARGRLRGVFGGHVHGTFQSYADGVLHVAGASSFAALTTTPDVDNPVIDRTQPAMINVVTITETGTVVRQRVLPAE